MLLVPHKDISFLYMLQIAVSIMNLSEHFGSKKQMTYDTNCFSYIFSFLSKFGLPSDTFNAPGQLTHFLCVHFALLTVVCTTRQCFLICIGLQLKLILHFKLYWELQQRPYFHIFVHHFYQC